MGLLTYKVLGDIALGGVATLRKVMLPNGALAVLRQLQMRKFFSLRVRGNFLSGARIRAALSPHSNIVNTLSWGGRFLRPYEFIEFVDGKDLKSLMMAADPVTRGARMPLLKEMAAALAWVHQNGFMHLDVKPENFLVIRRGEGVAVKLTDFDMALPADANGWRRQFGTPAYMAPEQFKEKRCYPASDVFAFGLMAYQLLSGRSPFTGETPKMMWRAQASSRILPKHIHELVDGLDPALEEIVMKCLSKTREARFQDMTQVAAELAKIKC